MGNTVTVKNDTRYPYTFCFTYTVSNYVIQGTKVLEANESYSSSQEAFVSYFYAKFGRHSGETCRDNYDLYCVYNGINNPVFTIEEIGWDRSQVIVKCNYGSGFPVGPNYGKQKEDEIRQAERVERERRIAEEIERERRIAEEIERERRIAEEIERERRIEEAIERESRALEEKLEKDAKCIKEKRQQREQNRAEECSHVMQYVIRGNAGDIETDEENDVEEKFKQLLIDYGINKDMSAASKDIGERMQTLQQYLIARYITMMGLDIWCHGRLNNALEKKMSLSEHLSLLQATAQVTLKGSGLDTTERQQYKDDLDKKSSFLIHILSILCKTNKTLAGKLSTKKTYTGNIN